MAHHKLRHRYAGAGITGAARRYPTPAQARAQRSPYLDAGITGAVTPYIATGQDEAPPPPAPVDTSGILKTASAAALTYHGYKRTGSLIWALVYGVAGRLVPIVAVPVAFAQGFGERKACP